MSEREVRALLDLEYERALRERFGDIVPEWEARLEPGPPKVIRGWRSGREAADRR